MAHEYKCSECGCSCRGVGGGGGGGKDDHTALHLHVEIENLKQKLLEKENHIMSMETHFLTEVDKFPNGEYAALAEELLTWQDKYSRLYEAHKRLQKVNQNLEDKLLKIVDKCETEKNILLKDVTQLKQKLVEANSNIVWLKEENERNRNDVNLAIQLLQCKPSNFVSQKFESLPADLQQKVKLYMSNKKDGNSQPKHEMKTIKVPIPTFPPTAMFYSVNKSSETESNNDQKSGKQVDIVSAAIMAKILEEREKERQNQKHCNTCICPLQRVFTDQMCQTDIVNPIKFDSAQLFIENHGLFQNSTNHIVKVESYQSQSPSISSAILIERSCVPISSNNVNNNKSINSNNNNGHIGGQTMMTTAAAAGTTAPKKNDVLKLNVGRNRYHSSKLSKGVNRGLYNNVKKEKSDDGVRNCEIYLDGGIRFSDASQCFAGDGGTAAVVGHGHAKDVVIDIEPDAERSSRFLPRRSSVNAQIGASNILLDNATSFSPDLTAPSLPYALVHSSRSRSVSDSASSTDECSELRPTETQI